MLLVLLVVGLLFKGIVGGEGDVELVANMAVVDPAGVEEFDSTLSIRTGRSIPWMPRLQDRDVKVGPVLTSSLLSLSIRLGL